MIASGRGFVEPGESLNADTSVTTRAFACQSLRNGAVCDCRIWTPIHQNSAAIRLDYSLVPQAEPVRRR